MGFAPFTGVRRLLLNSFRGFQQLGMLRGVRAARAISVLGHCETQRVSAEMRHLAEEFHGRFRVAVLQLAVCGTHAAQRLNLAAIANRGPRLLLCANLAQSPFPAFAKASLADVVA